MALGHSPQEKKKRITKWWAYRKIVANAGERAGNSLQLQETRTSCPSPGKSFLKKLKGIIIIEVDCLGDGCSEAGVGQGALKSDDDGLHIVFICHVLSALEADCRGRLAGSEDKVP